MHNIPLQKQNEDPIHLLLIGKFKFELRQGFFSHATIHFIQRTQQGLLGMWLFHMIFVVRVALIMSKRVRATAVVTMSCENSTSGWGGGGLWWC